jgi:CubicO group peptidase (beta-lactamase class C family)
MAAEINQAVAAHRGIPALHPGGPADADPTGGERFQRGGDLLDRYPVGQLHAPMFAHSPVPVLPVPNCYFWSMAASMEPDRDELRMMVGSPPFPPERLVTLENWQLPPYNRWAFQHLRELIPTARIPRGDGPVWELEREERDLSDISFTTQDGELTVGGLLYNTCTDGFLVLHRGRIVAEQYRNGLRPGTPHLLMSVSKSITGLVAGALAGRGVLDVTATVESIVPELKATSFRGATVQQLLDMRTGTRFGEDYRDPDSELAVSDRVYLWSPDHGRPRPADALEYFATLGNDGEHGGPFRYRSILVDVLAWVLERAADQRFPDLVASALWQPMGAEHDAEITVDSRGNPLADGGISATLRDAGRIGQLALQRGRVSGGAGESGRQVVPAEWIDDTIAGAPDGPQAFAQIDGASAYPRGAHYRNCWWVTNPDVPMFNAAGIHGQHIFVHVPSQTVVVKLSSWPDALNSDLRRSTVAAVTAIAEALAAGR